MKSSRLAIGIILSGTIGLLGVVAPGCHDNTPPPQRVPIPAQSTENSALREREDRPPMAPPPPSPAPYAAQSPAPASPDRDPVKPLPAPPQPMEQQFQPPFEDEPLVSQRPPEERAFVEAYRRVGAPRITLFVNRTLEGSIANYHQKGRAGYNERASDYLQRGQYDDAQAKSLDYEAIESIMTDWLAANGQVTIISPTMARQRLTDNQVKEMQSGRPQALSEIAQQLGAEILIQVQAHPTHQTAEGLEVRIVAEAINTKGGQSIGRAVVDVPPPLAKTTINKYTRYLARKLMDDMIATWSAPPAPEPPREMQPQTAPPPMPPQPAPAQQTPAQQAPVQQPMSAVPTTAPSTLPSR